MIIGVSGYIGSGKDTVGKIIQYLTDGYFHSKDHIKDKSFSAWLAPKKHTSGYDIGFSEIYDINNPDPWEIMKFAGKLKDIASIMTGIPVADFEKQEVKDSFLGKEWDRYYLWEGETYKAITRSELERREGKNCEIRRTRVREFLQRLGTEAVREGLHYDAWVNALFADYQSIGGTMDANRSRVKYPNWIITDLRFPNEAEAIQSRGGIIVRLNREIYIDNYPLMQGIPKHYSETALDEWSFDYVIENNGTIEELVEKVKTMCEHFNILKNEGISST